MKLEIFTAKYPLRQSFNISRGAKTVAHTIVVKLTDDKGNIGYGEAVPYARYNESLESVGQQILAMKDDISGMTTARLQRVMKAGSARNALDNALWDLASKQSGVFAWERIGIDEPKALLCTKTTISLDTPEAMAKSATGLEGILKLKLGGKRPDGTHDDLDGERLEAVRAAVPHARLTADVNEGWTLKELRLYRSVIDQCNLEVLEQPLPVGQDTDLMRSGAKPSCPVYADESLHTRDTLMALAGIYGGINIKLDKTGGFTEAMALKQQAMRLGYEIMVGCMVCGSLGIAPATLVAQGANWADLDGPLLVSADTDPRIEFEGDYLQPLRDDFWGGPKRSDLQIPGLKPFVS